MKKLKSMRATNGVRVACLFDKSPTKWAETRARFADVHSIVNGT
jgi:hypothetical protein